MSYIWVCRCCAGRPEAICATSPVPGFWDCRCRTETLSGCRQPWGLPAPPVNRSLAGTVAFLPRAALPRPEAAGLTWLFEFELKPIKSKIRTLSLTVTATFLGLRSCMWLVASVWGVDTVSHREGLWQVQPGARVGRRCLEATLHLAVGTLFSTGLLGGCCSEPRAQGCVLGLVSPCSSCPTSISTSPQVGYLGLPHLGEVVVTFSRPGDLSTNASYLHGLGCWWWRPLVMCL